MLTNNNSAMLQKNTEVANLCLKASTVTADNMSEAMSALMMAVQEFKRFVEGNR